MKEIVLFSGGYDSTVLLADRVDYGKRKIIAVSFDYGQTHRAKELAAARKIAKHYGVEHRIVGMSSVLLPSALTGAIDIPETHAEQPDATTVPARNMIFISIAAGIAEAEGADQILIGSNANDWNGYVDCRPEFVDAMAKAVMLGTQNNVLLIAPYKNLSKKTISDIAKELEVPVEWSWSCYRGGDEPCNNCGACEERNKL